MIMMEILWLISTAAKTIMILYNRLSEWSIIMINLTILMLITATSSVTSSHSYSSSTCRHWHAGRAGARQEAAPPWPPSYRNHIKASLWHNFDKNKWLTWSDLIKNLQLMSTLHDIWLSARLCQVYFSCVVGFDFMNKHLVSVNQGKGKHHLRQLVFAFYV